MAIFTGTTKTRFPDLMDPNSGIGVITGRLQKNAINFLNSNWNQFENNFVEDGVQDVAGFSTYDESYSNIKSPSSRRIITQRNQCTILIKKRMFSTLRGNYDIRFLDDKEKMFLRATKALMTKKAQDLSYYESLLNLESIFDNDGFLNIDQVSGHTIDAFFEAIKLADPSLANATQDQLINQSITDPTLNPYSRKILQLLRLKKANQRSKANALTTWIIDPDVPDTVGIGEGVGTLELNLVASFSANAGLNGGQANLTIEDPYRTLVISEADIEIALRQALAEKNSNRRSNQFISDTLLNRAKFLDEQLNGFRKIRGVSPINFEFTLGAANVLGTIVATGQQFDEFTMGNIDPPSDLDALETTYAFQILTLLKEYLTNLQDSAALFQTINKEYNEVRQRLRNEFVGHAVIQQMDMVHIFMNSYTRENTPNYDGRLDEQTSLIGTLNSSSDVLSDEMIESERLELAPDIEFPFYKVLRDKTIFRHDGVQVFCGPVTTVSSSYSASDGKFSISVSCKDNTEFLKMGRINVAPSLAQVGGMLEDPLTPFNLSTDTASGLISDTPTLSEENKKRLKYLRFDDGPLAGKRAATEKDIFQNKTLGGTVLNYQHMPGIIYRWKSGMVAETLNVNIKKPLNKVGNTLSDIADEFGVTVLSNPFGGLDVADIISILVTGRPHNYATFLKHSLDVGTFSVDTTNQSKFYFNYLFDFLERGSGLLGDFIPAVADIIDPVTANELYNQKRKIEGFNSRLTSLNRKMAELQDKNLAGFNTSAERGNIQVQIDILRKQIDDTLKSANGLAQKKSDEDNVKISFGAIGNEVYLNFDSEQMPEIKKKLKYQLKKKPEDVRFNQDKSYLIVSDKYDSDVDIQAFAKSLKNPELFNSDYRNPYDLCMDASKTVGFEFFADTQGNIVFRPPEYNKTPLSLMMRLLELSRAEQVGHIPPFLNALFATRKDTVKEQILLTELQILEGFVLLGRISTASDIFNRASKEFSFSIKMLEGSGAWQVDENYLNFEIQKTTLFDTGEQKALLDQTQLTFGPRDESSNLSVPTTEIFLITVQNAINNILGRPDKVKVIPPSTDDASDAATQLSRYNQEKDGNANLNRLTKINEIAKLISERQFLGRTYRALAEKHKIFDQPNKSGFRTKDESLFPQFLTDLIEDDTTNLDGFRSGKRFVIYDDVILNQETSVNTPDFTRVDVTGNQDFISTDQSGSLGGIPNVIWSGAVDFDLWRQFGYRPAQTFHRPDFTEAEAQCAPYAIFKLQEQRRRIHQANLTLVGNEHYQVGDVVYLNNKNMLYYVTNVSHQFSFDNGSYTTTLTLEYGRALGEYIPTTLDIIGKGLLSAHRAAISRVKANRSAVGSNHVVILETLFVPDYENFQTSDRVDEADGRETAIERIKKNFINNENNKNKIENAIKKAATRINQKQQGDALIEVRTYYTGTGVGTFSGESTAGTLGKAQIIGQWVFDMITKHSKETYDKFLSDKLAPKSVVLVNPINIAPDSKLTENEEKLRRFPSSQAWTGASKFVNADNVGIPVNAIDIVFVTEKSQFGDQTPAKLNRDGK